MRYEFWTSSALDTTRHFSTSLGDNRSDGFSEIARDPLRQSQYQLRKVAFSDERILAVIPGQLPVQTVQAVIV